MANMDIYEKELLGVRVLAGLPPTTAGQWVIMSQYLPSTRWPKGGKLGANEQLPDATHVPVYPLLYRRQSSRRGLVDIICLRVSVEGSWGGGGLLYYVLCDRGTIFFVYTTVQ